MKQGKIHYIIYSVILLFVVGGIFKNAFSPKESRHSAVDDQRSSSLRVPGEHKTLPIDANSQVQSSGVTGAVNNKEQHILSTQWWVQRLMKSRGYEREKWAKGWPEPKNDAEKMIILALSLSVIPDNELGSFENVLKNIGTVIDEYPKNPVNHYLGNVLQSANREEDAQLRSNIYLYNARHGVDDYLTRNLNYDIQMVAKKNIILDESTANTYLSALMESSDIDDEERFTQSVRLVQSVSGDQRQVMAERVRDTFEDMF